MRTEMARIQTAVQEESFKKNGFDQYIFLALGTACGICRAINGQHFQVDKMQPGENAPPMHPNCRCSTAAWMDTEKYNAWLDSGAAADGLSFDEFSAFPKGYSKESYDVNKTNTKKLKRSMNKGDYEEYIELINENENEDLKKMYSMYADKIKKISKGDSGCYYFNSNELIYRFRRENEISSGMSKYGTLAHEYGHYFDHKAKYTGLTYKEVSRIQRYTESGKDIFRKTASASDQFLEAVRKDREKLTSLSRQNKMYLGRNNASAGVQDAVDGLTGKRIRWGHGDKYYNRNWDGLDGKDQSNLLAAYRKQGLNVVDLNDAKMECRVYESASEMWANIMSAEVCGGEELKFVKEYLPNSYQAMREILKGVK